MMLLAFLRFDAQDTKGLGVTLDALQRFAGNFSQSVRLRRMAEIGRILVTLNEGKVAVGVLRARELVDEVSLPNFDMEAGTNMLSLWSRLDRFGVEDPEFSKVVTRVAKRFFGFQGGHRSAGRRRAPPPASRRLGARSPR